MATEVDTGALRTEIGSRRGMLIADITASALAFVVFAPILFYMVLHWRDDSNYSHGFIVALLVPYLIWERRKKLARTPIEPSWYGVIPLALGALALAIGRLGVELMSMRVAFVLTLIGIQLLLLGVPILRVLAFPMFLMFLMVPLPQSLVNVIAFPLQLIAADMAVGALHLFGFPVLREGNILHLPNMPLFVAEACSGLRSLMALGTLGVLFAYFFRKSWPERLLLIASTVPIAIIVNSFRVAMTAVLSYYKPELAKGAMHTTEGFITFAMALALLMAEGTLISFCIKLYRRPKATA